MKELLSLIRDLDLYISQHAIYTSKLEKAMEKREAFAHETHRECSFGIMFYTDIYPNLHDYPEWIQKLIVNIEKIHYEFHQLAGTINTRNPTDKDMETLRQVKEKGDALLRELLKLKRSVSSE